MSAIATPPLQTRAAFPRVRATLACTRALGVHACLLPRRSFDVLAVAVSADGGRAALALAGLALLATLGLAGPLVEAACVPVLVWLAVRLWPCSKARCGLAFMADLDTTEALVWAWLLVNAVSLATPVWFAQALAGALTGLAGGWLVLFDRESRGEEIGPSVAFWSMRVLAVCLALVALATASRFL